MGGCCRQAGKDGVNWSEVGKGRQMEPRGAPAPGKSSPTVPQCPVGEGSWMEPRAGSAGPANLLSLHPRFLGSMARGGEGAILPLLPGSPAGTSLPAPAIHTCPGRARSPARRGTLAGAAAVGRDRAAGRCSALLRGVMAAWGQGHGSAGIGTSSARQLCRRHRGCCQRLV